MKAWQTGGVHAWHFGMKAHVGVDADSGLVHTVVGTAANVNDVTKASALVHGEETDVFADAGYQGVIKRQFGFVKVRYRGLMKNTAQLHTLFALSNLWMARHRLLQSTQG
jgi:transposase, IS5 family